jgi:hypothetical protein
MCVFSGSEVVYIRLHTVCVCVCVLQCKLSAMSLDPRYAFIVDAGKQIFVWMGKKSSLMVRSKGRYC